METALKDVKTKFKKDGDKKLTVEKLSKLAKTVDDPAEVTEFLTAVLKLVKNQDIKCNKKLMTEHLTDILTAPPPSGKKKAKKKKKSPLQEIKTKFATGNGVKLTKTLVFEYDEEVKEEDLVTFWTNLLEMIEKGEIECDKPTALKKHLNRAILTAPKTGMKKKTVYREKVYGEQPRPGFGKLQRVVDEYLKKESEGAVNAKNIATMTSKLEYDDVNDDRGDLAQFISFVLSKQPKTPVLIVLFEKTSEIQNSKRRGQALDGIGLNDLNKLKKWCKEQTLDWKKMVRKNYWPEVKYNLGEEWMFKFEIQRKGAVAYNVLPDMDWQESDTELAMIGSRKKPSGPSYRGGMYCFPYQITPIMNKHLKLVPKDIEAFEDVFYTDDIWKMKQNQVKRITKAFMAAKSRQVELGLELSKMESFLEIDKNPNDRAMYMKARQFQTTMLSHFPYEFVSNQNIDLNTRLETIVEAKKWNDKERKERIAQLQDPGGDTLAEETKAFEVAITATQDEESKERLEKELKKKKLSLEKELEKKKLKLTSAFKVKKWWWYADPFDNKAVIPLSWEDTKALYKMNEQIVERAYKIRDCGGTAKDVEKALKHMPPGFWPPQLVDRLQAWRRTEREMKREVVLLKQVEAAKKAKAIDALLKALVAASDSLPLTNEEKEGVEKGFSEDESVKVEEALTKFHTWAKKVKPFAEEAEQHGIKKEKFLELMWDGNLDALEIEDEEFKETMKKWLGTFKKTDWLIYSTWVVGSPSYLTIFSTINSATSAAGKAFAEFAPFVGTAMLGIEFMALAKKARDARAMKTKVVTEEKLLRDQQERLPQDVALLNCIANEKNARKRARKENATYASARAISLAGGLADCTGLGATIGFAIKLVGSTVYYGGWAMFLISDKRSDTKMKKLLVSARAGDYKARVEIFASSAVYAKTYLSMKVKEYIEKRKKDKSTPLDTFIEEFLINRGITEKDIDTSNPLCVRMLREALMQHAGQTKMDVAPKLKAPIKP